MSTSRSMARPSASRPGISGTRSRRSARRSSMAKRIALLAFAVVMWIPVHAMAQGGDDPQVEKGRVVVAQVCTTCHTTLGRMLQVHKQTREQWSDLVFFMISRGAQVMPVELVAYPVAGTEGPVRLLDGSGILWTERNVSHISKIDLNGNRSTFVESAEGANGLGWDSKGRLLAVLRPRSGGERVAAIYPPA